MANIVLTGFMGTGKSSVGRRLAHELGLKFVDMDSLIEEAAGMPVKEIFARFGERRFRGLERETVGKLASGFYGGGLVVAAGGGAVVDGSNRAALRSWAKVVCLTASVDAILKRVGDNDERPLLNVDDKKAAVENILRVRQEAYRDADLTVDTSDAGIEEVVKEIKRFFDKSGRGGRQ